MTTMNSFLTACLVTAVALLGGTACVMQGDQSRQPDTSSRQAAPDSSAAASTARLPRVNFPADRNPSWITSVFEQEVQNEQAAAELARMGYEFNGKIFLEQVYAGNLKAVEVFLNAGMPPDMRSPGGITALMVAVESGNEDIARLLVERGADVTLREFRTTEMTALLYAARGGSAGMIEYLLDHGADVNECDARLETSLYMAVMEQQEDIVRMLLERGAQVDFPSLRNTTPLTYATGYPSLAIVRMLVEAGADLNATDGSGSTPLLVAAKFGQTANFNYLLEQGATNFGESATGYNALHAAAESGSIEIASQLLERGFDINLPDSRSAKTPLLIALAFQRLEMAEWLLANGADPLPRCIFGYSALDLARRLDADCAARTQAQRIDDKLPEPEYAHALLEKAEQAASVYHNTRGQKGAGTGDSMASADSRPEQAQTSLALPEPSLDQRTLDAIERIPAKQVDKLSETDARKLLADHDIDFTADVFVETCIFGWRRLFDIFLAAGIDPNIKREPDGGNAITAACLLGDPEMVEILIDHGADLGSTFNENQAPCMHFAAMSRNQAVVALLLRHGQDIDARDLGGRTALMKAGELGYQEVAANLISNGADVNAIDKNGLTALHWALRSDQAATFKFLVERGADVEIADTYNITPAFAAALFGREDLYLFLRERGARVDQVLDDGTTIIHAAVSGGQRAIVEDVLAAGYDINTRHAERGDTPIYGALDRLDANIDFIRFLLDSGAEINLFDKVVGYSPLMVAAINSNVDIFNLLIERGADIRAVSDKGITALHVATMNDSPEMVRTLLNLGADVQAKDGEGKTALDRAVEFRCNIVQPILREAMGLPAEEPAGKPAQ